MLAEPSASTEGGTVRATKIARVLCGNPEHADHYLDNRVNHNDRIQARARNLAVS
jgi:hypothetical protein